MALYEYDFYLFRERSRGSIVSELTASGLLRPVGDGAGYLFGKIGTEFRETLNDQASDGPLCTVSFFLESHDVNNMLRHEPDQFIEGIWDLAKRIDIAYAFIGLSSDAAYVQVGKFTSAQVFGQVNQLVETGTVAYVHPLMYFAERVGSGRVCQAAQRAPKYTVEHKDGVGCLLVLMNRLAGGRVSIEDPGIIYPELINYFTEQTRTGASSPP